VALSNALIRLVSGCVRESGPGSLAERADRVIDSLEETKPATRASGGAPTGGSLIGSNGHGQLTTYGLKCIGNRATQTQKDKADAKPNNSPKQQKHRHAYDSGGPMRKGRGGGRHRRSHLRAGLRMEGLCGQ
jgi:hypothetical protein